MNLIKTDMADKFKTVKIFSLTKVKSKKPRPGFTLLEVLVALAILVVIISLIYPAYTGTYRNIEAAETQAEIYQMARIALIRIIEDLESA